MKKTFTPAVVIILAILVINAIATLALWRSADQTANTAQKSAQTALTATKNTTKLLKLRLDQSCLVDEKQGDKTPAYCNEPGVGLPEKVNTGGK